MTPIWQSVWQLTAQGISIVLISMLLVIVMIKLTAFLLNNFCQENNKTNEQEQISTKTLTAIVQSAINRHTN